MKVLIKIGGTLLDEPASRQRLATEIAALPAAGVEAVVVHGGGQQLTRYLAANGVESRFVNGLRVTDAVTLDAVLKVLAGTVNHELVAAFVAAGARAVGLTGMDGNLTEAEPLHPALGHVGKPVRSNPALLNLLTANGFLPVVACLAGDRQGNFYNVNADQMAVACAAALAVPKLFFLTDVDGVRGQNGAIYPTLGPSQCEALIASGIATGGMQAKLNAAVAALRSGIGEVVIAPGSLRGVVAKLLSGQPAGTSLVAEAVAMEQT